MTVIFPTVTAICCALLLSTFFSFGLQGKVRTKLMKNDFHRHNGSIFLKKIRTPFTDFSNPWFLYHPNNLFNALHKPKTIKIKILFYPVGGLWSSQKLS